MENKNVTVGNVITLMDLQSHVLIVDRGIEEINARHYILRPENAIPKESTLYDGNLLGIASELNKREIGYITPLEDGFRLELKPNTDNATLYEYWITESDWVPGSDAWRTSLSPTFAKKIVRWDKIQDLYESESSDPDTREWRKELYPEEAKMVNKWDEDFRVGLIRTWERIYANKDENHINIM